ncbi:DUF4249 domain-containing protein [Sphingobacterium sp. MYb382]|uniref:DUF4249 domain-containing protein n=1 Tax=Sphingobacterium sp. MYb382 TaxID=2745278 RepID=UPI0030A73D10
MTLRAYFFMLISGFIFTSCEEVIDVNLNDSEARTVIEGQLSDLTSVQQIRVSETVSFSTDRNSKPIDKAVVLVRDDKGGFFTFQYTNNGIYEHRNFKPVAKRTYSLEVRVGEQVFKSTAVMPPYVTVDSIGILEQNVFKDTYYFMTFKFHDPKDVSNYYKYDMSINGKPFAFASTFNDKFNDGLFVTHQVGDFDNDLVQGDSITVRRYCIDKPVYNYWNEYQRTNPSNAAPGNPTSNISNNALGYFSVASAKQYGIRID